MPLIKQAPLIWKEYCPQKYKLLDNWTSPKYSDNYYLIKKYAFFDEKISENYLLYEKHKQPNEENIYKIISFKRKIVGICFFIYCPELKLLSINPY